MHKAKRTALHREKGPLHLPQCTNPWRNLSAGKRTICATGHNNDRIRKGKSSEWEKRYGTTYICSQNTVEIRSETSRGRSECDASEDVGGAPPMPSRLPT